MHIVFLRGAVPPSSEHPEKLLYDSIESCEDMWTQLFHRVLQLAGATGELLYQTGTKDRRTVVSGPLVERWVPSIKKYTPEQLPDVIIARGGFDYYDGFVQRFPGAKKIHYGAGKRFYPQGYNDYDLFLVDTEKQLRKVCGKGRKAEYLLKPAATLFSPQDVDKIYDVCFMANATQADIKRHRFMVKSMYRSGLRILNIGLTDNKLIALAEQRGTDVVWQGWCRRHELPALISQCRIGMCCSNTVDSCPRVIPEYLACGLPVLVTPDVRFWRERYLTEDTGLSVSDDAVVSGAYWLMERALTPHPYYVANLSMDVASKRLVDQVKDIQMTIVEPR